MRYHNESTIRNTCQMFVANTYVGMVWTDQCWGEAQGKDSHTRYGKWLSGCGIKYQYKKTKKNIFVYFYLLIFYSSTIRPQVLSGRQYQTKHSFYILISMLLPPNSIAFTS